MTEGEWQEKYSDLVKEHGFDCIYDALGGGPVTNELISRMNSPGGRYFMYGGLTQEPIILTNKMTLFSGLSLTGFNVMMWWMGQATEPTRQKVRSEYSHSLINFLNSSTYKEIKLE